IEEAAEQLGGGGQAVEALLALPDALLVDAVAALLQADDEWLREVLSTHDPIARAEKVLLRVVRVREAIAARKSIKERVEESTRDQQREFFLRQQLRAIQDELGEGGDDDDLTRLRERLEGVDLPDETREVVDREIKRLERLGNASPERSVAID